MNDYFSKIGDQISEFLKSMSAARKLAMAATAAVISVGIGAMFFWAGDTSFTPFMSNLNPEDSAGIIRVLREKKIPFKVDSTGRNITVPPESLYELRLELATMGLPQSGQVGYEIFDKQALGTTSFVHKVNQKRALEGELMRTINTLRGVRRSRVHLAIPQKSAFVEDQKKSTASVVLDLDAGTTLAEKQIFGIGNLIARAVEGMEVSDVVVTDSNGKLLSRNYTDPLAAATASQHEFRQRVESDLEHKVEQMLSRVVGEGKIVARVSADLDFSQVSETQTTYDSDGTAVRSQQRDIKSAEGSRPGPYGLAGAASNTPGQPPAANAQVKTDTKTENMTTNYEVPQTVRRVSRSPWEVKRLSVAVVVDGKTGRAPAGAAKGAPRPVEAWSPEKLKEFEAIIATAVGIDRKRGDTLEVRNMEFSHEDFEEAERLIAESERKSYIQNMVTYAVIGLIIVLFFLLVVRPFIKWITENTIDSVDSFLPQTIEELEKMQKNSSLPGMEDSMPVLPEKLDPDKVEGEMIKEKIITLVDTNPHKAALILKEWLHGVDHKKRPVEAPPGDKGKTA